MFRVYVGNLPYSVRDADLKEFFEKAGCSVTESTVVMMPDGRSKGFGFVSFADEDSFKKAQALSGSDMQGRSVRIDAARPKEDRGDGASRPMAAEKPAMDDAKSDDTDEDKANDMADAAEDKDEDGDDESDDEDDKKDEEVEA